jgi:hypothetical protein
VCVWWRRPTTPPRPCKPAFLHAYAPRGPCLLLRNPAPLPSVLVQELRLPAVLDVKWCDIACTHTDAHTY